MINIFRFHRGPAIFIMMDDSREHPIASPSPSPTSSNCQKSNQTAASNQYLVSQRCENHKVGHGRAAEGGISGSNNGYHLAIIPEECVMCYTFEGH
jgi:hypothetical protein